MVHAGQLPAEWPRTRQSPAENAACAARPSEPRVIRRQGKSRRPCSPNLINSCNIFGRSSARPFSHTLAWSPRTVNPPPVWQYLRRFATRCKVESPRPNTTSEIGTLLCCQLRHCPRNGGQIMGRQWLPAGQTPCHDHGAEHRRTSAICKGAIPKAIADQSGSGVTHRAIRGARAATRTSSSKRINLLAQHKCLR